jgi:hypothetical protein
MNNYNKKKEVEVEVEEELIKEDDIIKKDA